MAVSQFIVTGEPGNTSILRHIPGVVVRVPLGETVFERARDLSLILHREPGG